jgi:phosphopantetheinyl transferase
MTDVVETGATDVPSLGDGAPRMRLLDASALHLDEADLRRAARELSASTQADYLSRSYSYPYALVAWHDHPVGIDIERIGPSDAGFADLICTREERLEAARVSDLDRFLTSLWSSKEALAKGLGDALRYEPARLESPSRWSFRQAGAWRCSEISVDPDHVAWVCWKTDG